MRMSYSDAMRRSLAAGIVWISLILAVAVPAAAGVVLTRVSPPGGGYSAQLPRGWRFANASYPSDHSTHLWFDPANALRKMEVVLSGCVGCVSSGGAPNPSGGLPTDVVARTRLNRWEIAFEAYSSDDPYPDNGLVIVMHQGSHVEGYVEVGLWLPAKQHSTATTILDSFRLNG
jgi:hypothetical protein